jgi:hypothetical protein
LSPYLRWRIETWSGIDATTITPKQFFSFVWRHRAEVARYLKWVGANR